MPEHWEGDLTKRKGNDSVVSTLEGLSSGYLSLTNQEELDAIASKLNMRPRRRFDFKCPIEVVNELMAKHKDILRVN